MLNPAAWTAMPTTRARSHATFHLCVLCALRVLCVPSDTSATTRSRAALAVRRADGYNRAPRNSSLVVLGGELVALCTRNPL